MRTHFSTGIWAGAVGLVLAGSMAAHADSRGRKYKPPPPVSAITVTILRGTNGKPIPDAAVIFHPIKNNKDQGALELKSNPDGVVKIDVIPIGDTLRLQVIADGWNTFGEDYKIDQDSKEIVVKLKRPGPQHSDYRQSKQSPSDSTVAPKGQSTSAKPNGQVPIPQ